MVPLVLSALAFLAEPAAAGTLAVSWTSPGTEDPVHVTYTDVRTGPVPGLVATGPDGAQYIVHIALERPAAAEGETPSVVVEARILELTADRKGRARLKVLSAPRIQTDVGTPARIAQGSRVPVPGTDPVQFREHALRLEVLYTEEPGPAAP